MAEHRKSMSTKSFFNLLGHPVKLFVMVVTYISNLKKGEVLEEGAPVGGIPAVLGVLPVLLAEGPARPLGGLVGVGVSLICLMLIALLPRDKMNCSVGFVNYLL